MADYWLNKDTGADNPYPTNGTQANPWATFAYAMTQMASSDTLTIQKTTTPYNETGGFDLATFGNTQESHRVTIKGELISDRPIMSSTGQAQSVMDLKNNFYITMQDIIFDGADAGWNGIKGDNCQHVIVQRCKMLNVKHGYTQSSGVNDAVDISILDCEMTALQTDGDGVIINGPLDGVYIKRNYLHDPGSGDDAIQVQHTSTPYQVQNVEIDDNIILGANDESIIVQPATNVKVRNNYISGGAGNGLFIQHADNLEISDNKILNCQENGMRIRFYSTDSGINKDVSIHHNLVVGCNQSLSFWTGIYLQGYDGAGNPFEIYANTVYDTQGDAGGEGKGIRIVLDTGETSGTVVGYVINNISRDNYDDGLSIEGTYAGSVTVYHGGNDFYNNGGVAIDDGNGWGDNTGFAANITTDPQHIDPANDNFNLSPASPCIGTGDDQFPSRRGGGYDMGTNEYGAPVTRPTGTSGRAARLRHGKYYRGSSGNPNLLELVRMER